LGDLHAIAFGEKTAAREGGCCFMVELWLLANDVVDAFGNVFSGTCQSEVINLSQHANRDVVDSRMADAPIVGGWLETKVRRRQNVVDVVLPEAT
jgi:hypothetical protein